MDQNQVPAGGKTWLSNQLYAPDKKVDVCVYTTGPVGYVCSAQH